LLYIEPESTDAALHFSVEECCMERLPPDETAMMLWRTDSCVMLGSNQIADAEIDMEEAGRLGISVTRRSSGGGAIFTDLGTLLYSVISPFREGDDPARLAAERAVGPVVAALRGLGVDAVAEGRNDILVDGRKISGVAQYIRGNRLCTHGSLLFRADLDTLARLLRPDSGKISSKALRSVRGRVTNIAEHIRNPGGTPEFRAELRQALTKPLGLREYRLTEGDSACALRIRDEKYANPAWTFGKAPDFTYRNAARFQGGRTEVFLRVERGLVRSCRIQGDFLALRPLRGLESLIEGLDYRRGAVEDALRGTDLRPFLGSVSRNELLSCMFGGGDGR
jgi:lipoate-protein ligase A